MFIHALVFCPFQKLIIMRLPITLLFVLTTLTAFGQSRKGHVYLSGNTSLSAERIFTDPDPVQLLGFNQFTVTDEAAAVTWRARSSRIGYFLTNRLMLGSDLYVGTKISESFRESNYYLAPFVRYYVTNEPGKKVNLFAQLGFGTIGEYGFGRNFETNFHLGVGAEARLADDIAATALLRYKAEASGLNYTELEFRINAFVGGGLGKTAGLALAKGSLMLDPAIGSIQLGHRGRDETLNLITELNVSGGYFLRDRVMAEAGFSLNTDRYTSNSGLDRRFFIRESEQLAVTAIIGARYFIVGTSRLRPYLLGRTNFNLAEQIRIPASGGVTGDERTTTNSTLHLQAGAGTLFSLSSHLALDAEVNYAAPLSDGALREVHGRIGLKVFLPQ